MPNKKVPDAWEDDWETQADKAAAEEDASPAPSAHKTKAERLAEHAELQRQMWAAAEAPKEQYYVASSNNVPLASGFKPTMKLLSRKPATLGDDDEDGEAKKHQPTPEETRQRQRRELEEKQRRYDEARARIFQDTPKSGTPSGTTTPRKMTPPLNEEGRQNSRGGRGGRGNKGRGGHRKEINNRNDSDRPMSQSGAGGRGLFDPESSSKPGSSTTKRGGEGATMTSRGQNQVIRDPKGPDGSGRGGFGFAQRGAKEG